MVFFRASFSFNFMQPLTSSFVAIIFNSFYFSDIPELNVLLCLKKFRGSSIGTDGIYVSFLKIILPFVLSILAS